MKREESGSRIPDNNPSKAMDSKKEVEKSNDPKTDQDFPGYPHYPAKEDIMDQRTDTQRVDVDVEGFAAGPNATGLNQRFVSGQQKNQGEASTGNEEDTSRETDTDSLEALDGRKEEIGTPQNVSNEDLQKRDLPGSTPEEAKQ